MTVLNYNPGIARNITYLDEGEDVSAVIDGEHYRGIVDDIDRSDGDGSHTVTLSTQCGEVVLTVEEDGSDYDTNVDALKRWENHCDDVPDASIKGFDDEDKPEMVDHIEQMEAAIEDLQFALEHARAFLDGDLTVHMYEAKIDTYKLDNGGELAIDML